MTPRLAALFPVILIVACFDDGTSSVSDAGRPLLGIDFEPPPFVLDTPAGQQRSVYEGGCTFSKHLGGSCLDGSAPPREFAVVHPGDLISVDIPGYALQASPAPLVRIAPYWCSAPIAEASFVPGQSWVVDLEPGTYVMHMSARFEGDGE